MTVKAEKEAAKAAKAAEKEAAKAAKAAEKEAAVEPQGVPKWQSIDGPGVKCVPPDPGSRAERTGNVLAAQPRVSTFIPLDEREKPGVAFVAPQINGFRIDVLKGQYVSLPQQVHELLADSYKQTLQAINQANTVNPYTGETHSANLNNRSDADRKALEN